MCIIHREIELKNLNEIQAIIQANSELTPIEAIRAKCLDCTCGSSKEVRLCQVPKCPLWPYRLGVRPATIRKEEAKMLDWDEIGGARKAFFKPF